MGTNGLEAENQEKSIVNGRSFIVSIGKRMSMLEGFFVEELKKI
jgi:hypothetical protein